MRPFALGAVCLVLAASPALGADYDRTEKSPLYELRLRAPASAMAIAPVKAIILARYKADADEAKGEARQDRDGNPDFHPFVVDTIWRVTFESDTVLSLSAETFADTGGVHPNGGFQTLVWDKTAARAAPIDALFAPGHARSALNAIAGAASRAWEKADLQRTGQAAGPEMDMAKDGIAPDREKLKSYALSHAKGQATANGIVLLYGAGQVWPHVLGDFRLFVPVAVFARDLAPRWKAVFAPG